MNDANLYGLIYQNETDDYMIRAIVKATGPRFAEEKALKNRPEGFQLLSISRLTKARTLDSGEVIFV